MECRYCMLEKVENMKKTHKKYKKKGGDNGNKPKRVNLVTNQNRESACEQLKKYNLTGPSNMSCEEIELFQMANGQIPYGRTKIFDNIRYRTKTRTESLSEDDIKNATKLLDETIFLFGKPTGLIINIMNGLQDENKKRSSKKPFMMGLMHYLDLENNNENEDNNITPSAINKRTERIAITISGETNDNIQNSKDLAQMLIKLGYIDREYDFLKSDSTQKIHYVTSESYMQGPRFVPFKRLKPGKGDGLPQPSCNNGSTCVEPKLYQWANDQNISLDNIIGFSCMWIGDGSKEKDIMEEYQLSNIGQKIVQKMTIKETKKIMNDDVLKRIALPCPGCQMNFYDIVFGSPLPWINKDCYINDLEYTNEYPYEDKVVWNDGYITKKKSAF